MRADQHERAADIANRAQNIGQGHLLLDEKLWVSSFRLSAAIASSGIAAKIAERTPNFRLLYMIL